MNRPFASIALRLVLLVGLAPLAVQPVLAQTAALAGAASKRADMRGESVSPAVLHIADWAVHSGDHRRLPFIVVDKVNAKAVAFDAQGRLIRSAPVLLGMGVGDRFAPGVVDMDMYDTKPWQRVTPAGRFYADEARNLSGERVLWVDYDNGIAIHKVPGKRTAQRRHERIRSPNPADRRITYGCINVPVDFYEQVVHPQFKGKGGFVYVLPDSAPVQAVFRSYDVNGSVVARMHVSGRHPLALPIEKF